MKVNDLNTYDRDELLDEIRLLRTEREEINERLQLLMEQVLAIGSNLDRAIMALSVRRNELFADDPL